VSGASDPLVEALWQRWSGVAEQRVALLERFSQALATGTATDVGRAEAATAAHKLAGTLGTYGRPGSDQARALELLLKSTADAAPVPALVADLRRALRS
jgi:hypothetical protein